VIGTLYLVNVWGGGTGDGFQEDDALATAISSTGEVVGFAAESATSNRTTGFRASTSSLTGGEYRATTIRDSTLRTVRVFGVNGGGTVVGQAATNASANNEYAFKDDPSVPNGSGANQDGPTKQFLAPPSAALDVNSSGQIVGYDSDGNQHRAFLYTPGSGSTPIVQAPSEALALNDSGNVVGWREVSGAQRAFLYDGVVRDLPSSVTGSSRATAINHGGDIAGAIATPQNNGNGNGNTANEAFLLKAGASTHAALGVVQGFDESFANGINAAAWVVGEAARNGPNGETAWLWVEGQLFDLSAQLDRDWAGPEETGWTRLVTATAISDSGLIVGQGKYRILRGSIWTEESRAFVLHVIDVPAIPEPGTLLLLFTGLAAIGAVRMRRLGTH